MSFYFRGWEAIGWMEDNQIIKEKRERERKGSTAVLQHDIAELHSLVSPFHTQEYTQTTHKHTYIYIYIYIYSPPAAVDAATLYIYIYIYNVCVCVCDMRADNIAAEQRKVEKGHQSSTWAIMNTIA